MGWRLPAGFLTGYFCGALPFSLVVGYLRGVDIRRVGSGNVGATNVSRSCGKKWGAVAFALDAFKGFLPVFFLAPLLGGEAAKVACGFGAVAGHNWSVFLRFRGGKGTSTSIGVFSALLGWWMLGVVGVWALVAASTRYVSLASMCAGLALVPAALAHTWPPSAESGLATAGLAGAAFLMIIVRHRPNIARLLRGEEPRIGEARVDCGGVTGNP